MGQKRLNSIALTNVERAYANSILKNAMEKIIDIFGLRRNGISSSLDYSNPNRFIILPN